MASEWTNRHHQQDHISSTSDNASPTTAQQQNETRPDIENAIPGCPCSWCSRPPVYDYQAAMHTRDYQNPWFPTVAVTNPVAPYVNQTIGIDNPTAGIATITSGQTMVRPVGQEVLGLGNNWYPPRDDAGYASRSIQLEAHTSAAPYQAHNEIPAQDSLRRFAEHYFNKRESLVNAVHFEYGPSGRLQAVIMLDIADIL